VTPPLDNGWRGERGERRSGRGSVSAAVEVTTAVGGQLGGGGADADFSWTIDVVDTVGGTAAMGADGEEHADESAESTLDVLDTASAVVEPPEPDDDDHDVDADSNSVNHWMFVKNCHDP
jgi:hypothetical protein